MIKYFLTALAFACSLAATPTALAQAVGGPIQVRTGDVYTLDVTYTQTAEFGGESLEATVRQVYALSIVDAENRRWRYVPVSLSYDFPEGLGAGSGLAADYDWTTLSEAFSAMLRIATDVGFDCTVDEYGRCIDMTNWPVWSTRIENMVLMADAFARMIPPSGPAPISVAPAPPPVPEPPVRRQKSDDEDAETYVEPGMTELAAPAPDWNTIRGPVLAGLSRMLDGFDSRDAAAMMAGVYMPAYVQGRSLTPRQTVSVVDEYEMPFGAPPLRFNGTLRLERVDRRNNTATVVRRSTLDVESARASSAAVTAFMTEVLIEPTAAAVGGEAPPSAEMIQQMVDTMLSAVAYEENTTGIIDLSTGLARETTTDISIGLAGFGGTEEQPFQVHGRYVTRITAGAPDVPRLPRQ